MNKTSERINKQTDEEMLTVLAQINENIQATIPKSLVPDLGWFDRDRIKFENQWREIRLFLKSNRVIETDNRIMTILTCLRGDIAEIYAQQKLNELDKELRTQDQEDFVKEIKTMFSDKTKVADTKQKIEIFKQGKQNTANFIIEFKALAMKADIDKLHVIFLLKRNV